MRRLDMMIHEGTARKLSGPQYPDTHRRGMLHICGVRERDKGDIKAIVELMGYDNIV